MKTKDNLDFGDYCYVKQLRFHKEIIFYKYKVINQLTSNLYTDVPVFESKDTRHDKCERILTCILCGIDESKTIRFRLCDVLTEEEYTKLIYKANDERQRQ